MVTSRSRTRFRAGLGLEVNQAAILIASGFYRCRWDPRPTASTSTPTITPTVTQRV